MNDSFRTDVSGTQGSVHAGIGDIRNQTFITLTDSSGRTPRKQAEDDLRWLWQRFVPPQGFGIADQILKSHRSVFLDAQPGRGRIATAKMLLWELRRDNEDFYELLPQEGKGDHRLNTSHIGEGYRLWMDLSEADDQLWSEIQAELSQVRTVVQERAAYLVVVLPPKVENLRSEFYQYRVQVSGPRIDDVLRRYLHVAGIPFPEQLPPLQFLREDRSLEAVPRYVQRIASARKMADGLGDFGAWCTAADRALSSRQKEVAKLVDELRQGSQRALLLATAMLHGAHADSVHHASASLLQAVEHPADIRPKLLRTPLDRRLLGIGAEIDDTGRVRFKELDYDAEVRAYLWRHMPELHGHIKEWVRSTAESTDLRDGEWENLVTRFTDRCLADRYRPTWASLVERWTELPRSDRRMKAAALVLRHGLHDGRHGRFFRKQIYDWSCKTNLPSRLAEVIVVVCREDMAVSHPDEALVRLHHVARREEGKRAREALIGLVTGDRRFLRQMLSRLTESERNPDRTKWPRDAELFLELADPQALTDTGKLNHALVGERAIRIQLAGGWRFTFAQASHETWCIQAQKWLFTAAQNERFRNMLLDVLVTGGDQRTDILARLYTMTRRPELRATISDLVLQKIDAAQGVQFV